ncbi:MAG: hypothetical protein JWM44_735, partial [Bacilli bacterium]|nr:hypothetical protein [Bacilli bacterium]
ASKGVTSFLATTLTADRLTLERVVGEISSAIKRGTSGAEIVGIHLEGPFLNASRCGAQNPKNIRIGTVEELEAYTELAQGHVRLLTIAPEFEEHLEVIRSAVSHHITVSIGHSDATCECVLKAIEHGATHVTHLFNGMRPLHHREPGVVGAALLYDSLAVELICDGIHVHKELISYVFHTKPIDKVVLITDAMSAAGCADGNYMLGDFSVRVSGGSVRLTKDNGLAGSVLSMDQALRNAIDFTGKSLEYIIPSLTINPAKQIGIHERKGSIEVGKDADFVILDKALAVSATFVKGICVYHRSEVEL